MKHPAFVVLVAGTWLVTYSANVPNAAECFPRGQEINLEDNNIASLRDKLLKRTSGPKLRRTDVICIFGKPDSIYNDRQKLPSFVGKLNDKERLIVYGGPIGTPAASNTLYFFRKCRWSNSIVSTVLAKEK